MIKVLFRPLLNINREVTIDGVKKRVTIFEKGKLYRGLMHEKGIVTATSEKYHKDFKFNYNDAIFETDKFGHYVYYDDAGTKN